MMNREHDQAFTVAAEVLKPETAARFRALIEGAIFDQSSVKAQRSRMMAKPSPENKYFDMQAAKAILAHRRSAVAAIRIGQTAKLLDVIACAVDHRCGECRTALARAFCVQPQLEDSLCGCSRVEGLNGGDVAHDDSL